VRLGLPDAVESYTVPDVYAYLAEIRERGASAAYQHRRHREVKVFFSWCRRMGVVEENVFARVPLVRLEQKIIEPFSEAEVAALLGSQRRERHTGCRNYAVGHEYAIRYLIADAEGSDTLYQGGCVYVVLVPAVARRH
jgi:site-specific recombinase XerD